MSTTKERNRRSTLQERSLRARPTEWKTIAASRPSKRPPEPIAMACPLLPNEPMGVARHDPIRVLYITYDGLLEPLGRSQVVSYLASLARDGAEIAILSFEKPSDLDDPEKRRTLERSLENNAISWRPLVYHRSPRVAATLWDIVRGIAVGISIARRHRPRVVHARSYVAGVIGLALKAVSGALFLFDMRGFWPEERIELGLTRALGFTDRGTKLAERHLLEGADHIVVLTEAAKAILRDREAKARLHSPAQGEKPITVIPCCVDMERFQPGPRDRELERRFDLEGSIVVGNIGAFTRRYLTTEMFRFGFHLKAHRRGIRFVYLTAHEPGAVKRVARDAGLKDEDLLVLRAEPEDVPRWLTLFRLGIFFLRPSYAAKGSCFTKLGEFLAAGVPVVTNTGVGDVDRILGSQRSGRLLRGLTDRDLQTFATSAVSLLEGDEVPADVARACRSTAAEHFSLVDGVRRYRGIYDSLERAARPVERDPVAAEIG